MTWLKPSGSCFLIGLVHTRMMPGYSEGSASAALIALSICAGVASAFHLMLITWITVFGFVSAANRLAASMVVAAQAPNNNLDRKSTRLNSSHLGISYAVFCL